MLNSNLIFAIKIKYHGQINIIFQKKELSSSGSVVIDTSITMDAI